MKKPCLIAATLLFLFFYGNSVYIEAENEAFAVTSATNPIYFYSPALSHDSSPNKVQNCNNSKMKWWGLFPSVDKQDNHCSENKAQNYNSNGKFNTPEARRQADEQDSNNHGKVIQPCKGLDLTGIAIILSPFLLALLIISHLVIVSRCSK